MSLGHDSLMTAARAAGYTMIPPEEDPVTEPEAPEDTLASTALVPATPGQANAAPSLQTAWYVVRSKLKGLPTQGRSPWRETVTHWLTWRAPA